MSEEQTQQTQQTAQPTTLVEERKRAFLATPDAKSLVALYEVLDDEGCDDLLAGILDKVRPIQHRVTLVQADAAPKLLEALTRDPHRHVRQVVAAHPGITDEVCFRLCEDQEHGVRLVLRKNNACHPVLRASLMLRERKSEEERVKADHLLEIAWQARRLEMDTTKLEELLEEWTGLGAERLIHITVEQCNLMLEVFDGLLGKGPMPKKPRRKSGTSQRSSR